MAIEQKYQSPVGEFIVNEHGRHFNLGDEYSSLWWHRLSQGTVFEENGYKGLEKDGQILLYPIFDEIAFVSSPGRIYLVTGERFSVLYANGNYDLYDWYEKDSHFIFNDGKMGWEKNGKIVVEPRFDDVVRWGYGLFLCKDHSGVHYLNAEGEEKLTFRRKVMHDDEEPFWLRTDEGDYMTITECPPTTGLPESNIIDYRGMKVGIDRYNALAYLHELKNEKDILPFTDRKLRNFTNSFAYEFSVYRFTVSGENPFEEITKVMELFDVSDNTWYYVMRFTTPPGELLPVEQMHRLTCYLDGLDHKTLGRAFAVGTDDKLAPGTVSVLLITHYLECCFPPEIQYDFVDICKTGTLNEVMEKNAELISFTRTSIYDENQNDFLLDTYETAFSNLGYNPDRSWEETEKILDFLASKTDIYTGYVNRITEIIISCSRDSLRKDEAEFYFNYLKWLLERGVSANPVKRRETPLNRLENARKKNHIKLTEIIDKTYELLVSHGAMTYAGFKASYLKNHSKQDFALYLLGNEDNTPCSKGMATIG